jgi:predicted AAA+ superfamily ATPase
MIREKMHELNAWKNSPMRKPLILRGARQVGKTWLLQEFGKTAYNSFVYINFEDTPTLQSLFTTDFDIERIINVLQIQSGQKISSDTLIIFDEIQAVERGITSLKYFYEKAPQYHIIAAGSLLGMGLHSKISFPVGKVDFLDLRPLSFYEFLCALGEMPLAEAIKLNNWSSLEPFREKLIEYLRQYFYIGGMPEVVDHYAKTRDWQAVRHIQQRILQSYESDFSKHAPAKIVPRIRMVWQSIPAQLSKENKKFVYGVIKEGARAKDFELAIQWLVDCGLLLKIHRISKPSMPLIAYQDQAAFKLYLLDIGLLSAMTDLPLQTLINGNKVFTEFKGSLSEQFAMQQLRLNSDRYIFYWSNEKSTSEVDFVIQEEGKIIPIEVKSSENVKAKSFKFFCEKYKPEVAIRASLSDYRKEDWMTNIPLFSIQ